MKFLITQEFIKFSDFIIKAGDFLSFVSLLLSTADAVAALTIPNWD